MGSPSAPALRLRSAQVKPSPFLRVPTFSQPEDQDGKMGAAVGIQVRLLAAKSMTSRGKSVAFLCCQQAKTAISEEMGKPGDGSDVSGMDSTWVISLADVTDYPMAVHSRRCGRGCAVAATST